MTGALEVLDTSLDANVATYERAFFAAFSARCDHGPTRRLWRYDVAAGRLAARIGYDRQIVFVERRADGAVGSAIAVSTDLSDFQSRAFGFEPPIVAADGCEFLSFFVHADHALASRFRFWAAVFAELRRRGFRFGLATTAPHVLFLYQRMGAEVLETRPIACGDTRTLLRFDLSRDYFRPRRTLFAGGRAGPGRAEARPW